MRHQKAIVAMCTAASLLGGLAASQMPTASSGGTAVNWPNTGGSVDESGFSQLGQITTANVGKLGLAWSLDLDDDVTLEVRPSPSMA